MPRGRLSERLVQETAIAWLEDYYAQQANVWVTTSRMEKVVKEKTKLGWGRVDGLIAMLTESQSVHVASMEAKSIKTIMNITLNYNDDKWMGHGLVIGFFFSLTGIIMGIILSSWLWAILLSIVLFFLSTILFLWASSESKFYKKLDVVDQIKRYPANEKWLAFSTDLYNQLDKDSLQRLHRDIVRQGIGLLRVSPGRKVIIVEKPRFIDTPERYSCFLDCYAKGADIIQELEAVSLYQECKSTTSSESTIAQDIGV